MDLAMRDGGPQRRAINRSVLVMGLLVTSARCWPRANKLLNTMDAGEPIKGGEA